ncbi:hypothetical protein [Pseudoalteromonas sp. T1lg24]|uniref:hypothetical protein n=1 Tax=Pseudoalteromonas sp. T1lg24 TaxID=2077099 RepID=UPI000CF6606E|nr:hypothetical protein [Pseudoalteromonas sp. T1lg24]
MLESLTVFLLICLMCLLGVFTLALIILIITITLTLVPKTPKLCKKAIFYSSKSLKELIEWVLILFNKINVLMSKVSNLISAHKLLAALVVYTIAIVIFFFCRFELSFYTPLKNWESTAVYFNNMLSPVFLFATFFYALKTFKEEKNKAHDSLFVKDISITLNTLVEHLESENIERLDKLLVDLETDEKKLTQSYKDLINSNSLITNNEIYKWIYENRENIQSNLLNFTPPQIYSFLEAINQLKSDSTQGYFRYLFLEKIGYKFTFLKLVVYELENSVNLFEALSVKDTDSSKPFKSKLNTIKEIIALDEGLSVLIKM